MFVLHVKQIMNEREMKKKQSNKNNIHLGSFQGSDLQVLESKVYSGTSSSGTYIPKQTNELLLEERYQHDDHSLTKLAYYTSDSSFYDTSSGYSQV